MNYIKRPVRCRMKYAMFFMTSIGCLLCVPLYMYWEPKSLSQHEIAMTNKPVEDSYKRKQTQTDASSHTKPELQQTDASSHTKPELQQTDASPHTKHTHQHTDTSSHTTRVHPRKKDHFQPLEDLMKAGPFKFLPNYKNPCWLNPKSWNSTTEPRILCLPYYYMIGAPKCGTTDMHQRLIQHPQIVADQKKEYHWFTERRYRTNYTTLRDYQRQYFTKATQEVLRQKDSEGRHNLVFGDSSPDNLWCNSPLMHHFPFDNATISDILHHLNPNVKLIVMLRNPVERLYSAFQNFQHGTPQEFHNITVQAIPLLNKCFKENSFRDCLYHLNPLLDIRSSLKIGIYSAHLQEWFRVFPREQIMIIKLEDFSTNTDSYMKKVFSFLDLAPPSDTILQKLSSPDKKANTRKWEDKNKGEMLPETRRILQDFYRPFNDDLVKLLGKSFNFNT